MRYDDLLEIDEADKEIIRILQDNPDITHQEIAEMIHKSQPAIGARIIKLKRKFLLSNIFGADFNQNDVKLARIDIMAKNVEEIWDRLAHCPYISNAFKTTGDYNIIIEMVAPDVKSIDFFVDKCLRKDANIMALRINFIINSLRKYVTPLSFQIEKFDGDCNVDCGGKMTKEELKEILKVK